MTHLHGELSPYLQAHADNPIDWYPWGQDAFDEAKKRDVPVLISIGYHTCHWCHVMARESFSDPDVGRKVNDSMVAIKVDREEHPDVDSHYLTQAGAFIEQLGWPLTIFATPEGDVFHAATYLPPEPRGEIPSFVNTIDAVVAAWQSSREDVDQGALRLRDAIAAADAEAKKRAPKTLTPDDWAQVLDHVAAQEDTEFGGLGTAPKFPIAPVLSMLVSTERQDSVALARRTLETIAESPLRDSVEGGFFRYATKRDWSEPHYERMLYDNAQLLWLYSATGQIDVAAGVVQFLSTVMRLDRGLASAQDSESVIDGERVEGGYYLLDHVARSRLDPPARDEKVLAGWNGLALWGLARAAMVSVPGEPLALARSIAEEVTSLHLSDDGRLARMSRDGVVSPAAATLEDYGGMAMGLLELALASGEVKWAQVARALVDSCVSDAGEWAVPGGGDPTVQSLEAISGDVTEGAMPSGLAMISQASLGLHQLTGQASYRDVVAASVAPYAEAVSLRPLGFGGLASVLWRLDAPLRELVVVTDEPEGELAQTAVMQVPPTTLTSVVTRAQAQQWSEAGFELFDGRFDSETPVAYLCQDRVCGMPLTDPVALRHALTN